MFRLNRIPESLLYCLLGMLIMYVFFELKSRTWVQTSADDLLNTQIKILVRQIGRWCLAAKQDKSPFIAVLHANYAAGFYWALLDIASKDQIERATNMDFDIITKLVMGVQDSASKLAIKTCPDFSSDNSYLSVLSGVKTKQQIS
jgi:hypothetical protein